MAKKEKQDKKRKTGKTRSSVKRQKKKQTTSQKWIASPVDHEDREGQSLATRNHEVIRRWAEERGGEPATVEGTEYEERPGVLRFDFPGFAGQRLKKIAWDFWFKSFDDRNLIFRFQEHMKNGRPSNFFQLDNPDREDA